MKEYFIQMSCRVHFGIWVMALLAGQLLFCRANSTEFNLNSNGATTMPTASTTNSPTSPVNGASETLANGTKEVENTSLLTAGDVSNIYGDRTELPTVSSTTTVQQTKTSTTTATATSIAGETAATATTTTTITTAKKTTALATESPIKVTSSKMVGENTETVFAATENTSSKPEQSIDVSTPAVAITSTDATVDVTSVSLPTVTEGIITSSSASSLSASTEEAHSPKSHITITPIDLKLSTVAGLPSATIANKKTEQSSSQASQASTAPPAAPAPTKNHGFIEQKLDNGLYRVKLAEIITDEFDNGLGDRDDETNSIPNHAPILPNKYRTPSYNNGKINIADLYPSKLEDFSPIIRESNEKLIKEKNLFTGSINSDTTTEQRLQDGFGDDSSGGSSSYQQINSVQSEEQTNDNGALNSIGNNIPTTKIEIELIDEPNAAKDEVRVIGADDDDGVIDLTAKLQENDGVISTIERDFLKIASDESDDIVSQPMRTTVAPTISPITVNHPINGMEFIERRVKKHDPTFKNKFANLNGLKRSDIGNTKFNGDTGDAKYSNDKPEFSTTKFYNSKELYSELQTENLTKPVSEINVNEAITAMPIQQAKTPVSAASTRKSISVVPNETVKSTPTPMPMADLVTHIIMSTKNPEHQKILFFNVNGKPNHKEEERLQKDRAQIIKDKNVQNKIENNTHGINEQRQQNMHLYVIHDADNSGNKVNITEAVNQNSVAKLTKNTQPQQRSTTTTASTPAASTTMASTSPTRQLSTASSNVVPAAAIVSSNEQRPYSRRSRPRVLTHLQEKINSLDCDMQNAMPKDANVWRGNETHELNLPTTVSQFCICFYVCAVCYVFM